MPNNRILGCGQCDHNMRPIHMVEQDFYCNIFFRSCQTQKKKRTSAPGAALGFKTEQNGSARERLSGPIFLAVASIRAFSLGKRSLSDMQLTDCLIFALPFPSDGRYSKDRSCGASTDQPRQRATVPRTGNGVLITAGFLRDTPIKRKLMLVIMLTTGFALLLTASALTTYETATFRRSLAADMGALARIIGSNSMSVLASQDRKTAQQILAALSAERRVTEAAIYDREGNNFARFPTNLPVTIKVLDSAV